MKDGLRRLGTVWCMSGWLALLTPGWAAPAEVSGRVLDDMGQPVPEATVVLQVFLPCPQNVLLRLPEWFRRWEVKCDGEGRYAVSVEPPAVPKGQLWLLAVASADESVDATSLPTVWNLVFGPDGRNRRAIDVRLGPGAVAVRGCVVDPDGQPVAGAAVYAVSTGTAGGPPVWHLPRTADTDGRFRLVVGPEATSELIVQSEAWAPARVRVPPGDGDCGEVRLTAGTRASGTLLGDDGTPKAGYWVVAESTDGSSLSSVHNPITAGARTDAQGRFRLPPLAGRFKLGVPVRFHPWQTAPREFSPAPRVVVAPVEVDLPAKDGSVTMDLRAAATVKVTGRVVGLKGEPAAGVLIDFYGNVRRPEHQVEFDLVCTDEQGLYASHSVPRGAREVMVTGSMLLPWTERPGWYLKAMPAPGVAGARPDGQVYCEEVSADVAGVNFRLRPFKPGQGVVEPPP